MRGRKRILFLLCTLLVLSTFVAGAAGQGNASDYIQKGIESAYSGDYEAAIVEYDRAIVLCPGCAEAHYNKGIALANLGRSEEAIAEYDLALKSDPDLLEAQYNRSMAILLGDLSILAIIVLIVILCAMIYRKRRLHQKRVERIEGRH